MILFYSIKKGKVSRYFFNHLLSFLKGWENHALGVFSAR
ncbi:hypothetical protein ADICYQ_0262 [Cyclobacterium qasimii M12-11B]|uniref:Uncharacterized protein n=1 Tax=Cyclobacterium qasimii M12-11B TaxID=641524 RepID=S7WXU8_9BACT|nr:hypothetical protein ADICYQ_0262 [Cyclobacterium qasimii M12-11B]